MTDRYARTAIKHAHKRINQLHAHIDRLEKVARRQPMFIGRCVLCGEPCRPRGRYCHAHKWAEGDR